MKIYYQNHVKNIFFIIQILIFSFTLHEFKSEEIQCPNYKPILISRECKLDFCTKDQFNTSECEIANPIIKTQWLNNIINFGEKDYRYLTFGTYLNGDMIIETTANPKSKKRIFYGLKKNGRPFFKNNITNEETSFYSINATLDNGQYEIDGFVIKLSGNTNNGKEYFISISKLEGFTEIFDFDNDKLYYYKMKDFTSIKNAISKRNTILPLYNIGSEFYYLIGFLGNKTTSSSSINTVYFQKHIFNSIKDIEEIDESDMKKVEKGYNSGISCFKTDSEKIICFYLTKETNKIYFNKHKFDKDFSNDIIKRFECKYDIDQLYYKAIHFKDEIGVFSFYSKITDDDIFPVFLFEEFINDDFIEYISVMISKNDFCKLMFLNDMIKINDNKIIFVSPLQSKEKLYIILMNVFGNKKIKIRYYLIELYALYHLKIYKDLRINNYNNFLAFAFSYYSNNNDDDEHKSALIIFSYPNSIDTTLYLDDYLLNNNNIDIKNLKIDLKTQLNIENNIFGYILSNISIRIVTGPHHDYKAYSSKYDSNEIKENYTLEVDENIIFKYIGTDDHLKIIDKKIEYIFMVTEPDYNIYETYPNETKGDNDEIYFKKEVYIGKYSYYNIKSKKEFGFICNNTNCNACIRDTPSYCLSCKYNNSLSGESGKNCYDKETDLITTEIITDTTTEFPTTEPKTQSPTTEPVTEISTTEPITYSPITEPVKEISTTEQITQSPTTEPVTEISTTESITHSPITEQVKEISTTEPITQSPTTEPVKEISTTEPITHSPITEQVKEISTTEPIIEESSPQTSETIIKNNNKCSNQDILNN